MLLYKNIHYMILIFIVSIGVSGCTSTRKGNSGNLQSYPFESVEAEWIRNGDPIEFEQDFWYPADGIESLTDAEVIQVTVFKEVRIFVDKVDVRPYDRLYTKFGTNKFRYYRKRN